MLADFCRNLTIRHFVGRLQLDDAYPKFLALNALAELAFSFAGAKDQYCFCSTQATNHLIVVFLAMVLDLVPSPIFRKKIILRIRGRRLCMTGSPRPFFKCLI